MEAKSVHDDLHSALGDDTPPYTTVARDGQKHFAKVGRNRRRTKTCNRGNIEEVRRLIDNDSYYDIVEPNTKHLFRWNES